MLDVLQKIRGNAGQAKTTGLDDQTISNFLEVDATLRHAIKDAGEIYNQMEKDGYSDLLKMGEQDLSDKLQHGLVNFYPENQTNPYVSLAARGPWIITVHGAVIHDSGGYGMLGLGHSPQEIMDTMAKPHVIANVMTPNISQLKLVNKLNENIGIRSKVSPLYSKFICMNSGSESVTVAARISDINAKNHTDEGARHHGKDIKFLSVEGGFHGRTDRPAKASPSTRKKYNPLASFRGYQDTLTVKTNDVEDLKRVYAHAEANNIFIEMFLMEPVMGEGNPGLAVDPDFYKAARELTTKHGSLLLVDSIQAGLRATGVLSICDYPGFENQLPPDMETYSKALNAGQYPLSILAMTESAAKIYVKGVYGNTMTTNPRALEVACTVMDQITPKVRQNIVDRGEEFLTKFKALQQKKPSVITNVQGTGLLFCVELEPSKYPVVGFDEVEEKLRKMGLGVIHGGKNALRFTPHFKITSAEIDMIVDHVDKVLV